MNLELTIKQSEIADKLLKELILKNRLEKDSVASFFKNADEAYYACHIIQKTGLINLVAPTESAPFILLTANDGIESFLENGGFTKIATQRENETDKENERRLKQDEILDLELKLKRFESKVGTKLLIGGAIITFLSFLITVLTLKYWGTFNEQSSQKPKIEKLDIQETHSIPRDSLN